MKLNSVPNFLGKHEKHIAHFRPIKVSRLVNLNMFQNGSKCFRNRMDYRMRQRKVEFRFQSWKNPTIVEWLRGEPVIAQEPHNSSGDMPECIVCLPAEKHTIRQTQIWFAKQGKHWKERSGSIDVINTYQSPFGTGMHLPGIEPEPQPWKGSILPLN